MPPTLKPNNTSELGRALAAIDGLAELTARIDALRNHPIPRPSSSSSTPQPTRSSPANPSPTTWASGSCKPSRNSPQRRPRSR